MHNHSLMFIYENVMLIFLDHSLLINALLSWPGFRYTQNVMFTSIHFTHVWFLVAPVIFVHMTGLLLETISIMVFMK